MDFKDVQVGEREKGFNSFILKLDKLITGDREITEPDDDLYYSGKSFLFFLTAYISTKQNGSGEFMLNRDPERNAGKVGLFIQASSIRGGLM